MKITTCVTSSIVILALLAGGCSGDKKTKISGKITYKNEPLKGGTVYLYDDAGASYSSPIQNDGAYLVTDIMPGSYSMTVETETANPDNKGTGPSEVKSGANKGMVGKQAKMNDEYSKQMGMSPGSEGSPTSRAELLKRYVKIPAKYGVKSTSNLKVEVLTGATVKDIPLAD